MSLKMSMCSIFQLFSFGTQLVRYIVDNRLTDDFQSAYKCGHSIETALLRVYNDIVVTIGKDNGNFLVLLDLSLVFDAID